MWLVAICVIIGFVLSKRLLRWSDRMIRVGLYILLIAMGMNLGRSEEIMRAIPILGAQALLYCLASSLVSVLAVFLYERLFIHRFIRRGKPRERSGLGREAFLIGIIALCVILGVLSGKYWITMPANLAGVLFNLSLVIICTAIGVTIRGSLHFITQTKKIWLYAMVPVMVTIGSVAGGLLAGLFTGLDPVDSAAIGGTMVFYSFASVVITHQSGVDIGLLALLSNILREILTFAAVPFLSRFSELSAFGVGGASTMDVTLPVIKRSLPEEYTLLGIFNGVVLSVAVPLLLMLLYGLA
jgi:uncharacterized membrane protein YbjE (DUF340 family)